MVRGQRINFIHIEFYTKFINKLFYLDSDILAKSSRKAELGLVII